MNATSDQLEKFHELLTNFKTAMLITFAADGTSHARPMAIARITSDNVLWFVAGRDSGKTAEILQNGRAHVLCQNNSTFLSIQGEALLSHNPAQIRAVWKDVFRAWFPQGMGDPNLGLIEVRPVRAEYWDNHGINKVTYFWEVARAYLTGTKAEAQEGVLHGVLG